MNGSLQLGARVAAGPLATVHRGVVDGRTVAVKRARPEVPGAADALRREARILGAVSHPAVIPVLELLEDARTPALVLGWADGGSLADLLADGPVARADLLHLLRLVADGLDALHGAGVVHLDVSVRNVLLAAAGPVLIDPAPPNAGTPGYADPFVAAGGPPSPRSDVYGLAACAHVAITGRLPRTAGGVAVGVDLPAPVAGVLDAALDPDPRRRPASAGAFVARLEAGLEGAVPAPIAPVQGRPVARSTPLSAEPVRTWPFDRWQEEADAAEARRAALATALDDDPPPARPGRRRWLAIAVAAALVLLATVAGVGAWWSNRTVTSARSAPRRMTAPVVPMHHVHRQPPTLEAEHDTTTPDRALAYARGQGQEPVAEHPRGM